MLLLASPTFPHVDANSDAGAVRGLGCQSKQELSPLDPREIRELSDSETVNFGRKAWHFPLASAAVDCPVVVQI